MVGWRGLTAGDLSIPQATLHFPLGGAFAGRGGALRGHQCHRYFFPGGGLGALFRVSVLPAGSIGQEKATASLRGRLVHLYRAVLAWSPQDYQPDSIRSPRPLVCTTYCNKYFFIEIYAILPPTRRCD